VAILQHSPVDGTKEIKEGSGMFISQRPHAGLGIVLLTLSSVVLSAPLAAADAGSAQSAPAALKDPVQTDAGLVSGIAVGGAGQAVRVYRGIPYAAPPVGDLRWKVPQAVTPWKGVKKAVNFSAMAPQFYRAGMRRAEADQSKMSEDSLYLNVTTPAKAPGDRLPVMVWLHAGGLDTGTANTETYNNPALARHGVVMVTVNHRLGAFGLLATPELTAESPHNASGNYGLIDLVAALQWVKQNIAAFGGDPDRVTIFGQGGGAQKVIWLLASPLAKGLFHRAIVESGTNLNVGDKNIRVDTEYEAYLVSQNFLTKIGRRNLAELRAKTWRQIVDAMPPPPAGAETIPAADYRMHPTIDAWSLTDHPINILDEDIGTDVPVLVGGDAGEDGVFRGYAADWLPAFANAKSNVYVYRFMHVPAKWKQAGMIAPHGFEVRYHFGNLGGTWKAPPGLPRDPGLNKDDETVAENTMRMWVNFAATGDPSVEGLVKWPAFKAVPGHDQYVTIDVKPEVRSGFLETFKRSEAQTSQTE
jgi:para-nitrobenzyl esterase